MNSSDEGQLELSVPECAAGAHGHLARFTFELPDPIGVPDGFGSLQVHLPFEGSDLKTWAEVVVHQMALMVDRGGAKGEGAAQLLEAQGAFQSELDAEAEADPRPEMLSPEVDKRSVAQVTTSYHSVESPSDDWDGTMAHLPVQQDAFMRALHATQTVVRGANLVGASPPARLPTYELVPWPIFVQTATTTGSLTVDDLQQINFDWDEPGLFGPNKDYVAPLEPIAVCGNEVEKWMAEVGFGNPAVASREQFLRAWRSFDCDGDYGQAVVSSATALESLCFNLVSALYWETSIIEERNKLEEAAETLPSGRATPLSVAQTKLPSLLGGDWTSSKSHWQRYRSTGADLRNRIVHTGFTPKRKEAKEAMDSALDAQAFLLDRLADRRNDYPLATYIFLGAKGLEDRSLFHKKIRKEFGRISENPMPPSLAFGHWALELEEAVKRRRA